MTRRWFGPKRYGWGWSPVTWEGWVATLAVVVAPFAALFIASSATDSGSARTTAVVTTSVTAVAVLVVLAVFKGEKPRWRWGGRN